MRLKSLSKPIIVTKEKQGFEIRIALKCGRDHKLEKELLKSIFFEYRLELCCRVKWKRWDENFIHFDEASQFQKEIRKVYLLGFLFSLECDERRRLSHQIDVNGIA